MADVPAGCRRINFNCPEALYADLKEEAALSKRTITSLVIEVLYERLQAKHGALAAASVASLPDWARAPLTTEKAEPIRPIVLEPVLPEVNDIDDKPEEEEVIDSRLL